MPNPTFLFFEISDDMGVRSGPVLALFAVVVGGPVDNRRLEFSVSVELSIPSEFREIESAPCIPTDLVDGRRWADLSEPIFISIKRIRWIVAAVWRRSRPSGASDVERIIRPPTEFWHQWPFFHVE